MNGALSNSTLPAEAQAGAQFFCHNVEGWGPLSPYRYDFTPCFLDVPVTIVAVFGIVAGSVNLWALLRTKSKQPTVKDWHYYAKLILVAALAITTSLQAYAQIESHPGLWIADFRFWSTTLLIASLGVAFAVHESEHERSRVPSAVLLFYWLFYSGVYIIKIRSLAEQQKYSGQGFYFFLVCVSFVLATSVLALEWLVPKRQSMYRAVGEDEKECPSEYSNIFSRLTFGWMTPLMRRGYKSYLTEEDLWDLPERYTTAWTGDIFSSNWEKQVKKRKPSLWMALFHSYGKTYISFMVVKLVADCLAYTQPQLLRYLISFIETYQTDNPDPPMRGISIAVGMFLVAVLQLLFQNQFNNNIFALGQVVKSGLVATIYKKSLRLSNEGRAAKTTGDIVNLMAVDTQRIGELSRQGFALWSSPFQITLCMISLYQLMGFSGFTGLVVIIVMIPINGFIARHMKRLQKLQMANKDSRTRLMTEILNNMKSIKLYSWTTAFMNKLEEVRNDKELKTLRRFAAVNATARFSWTVTPFLVSCSTFLVYVLTHDEPLTVDIVFPAITLFNLLAMPLMMLPNVLSSVIESTVAINRLSSFFQAEELQDNAVVSLPAARANGEEAVRVRGASFTWGSDTDLPVLSDINISACKGELSCIVGRVGSGKSSLLQAVLGDLRKIHGEVMVRGTVAYVAQQAWIMNASVKDNIIFGHRWDPAFYERTIKACALAEDLAVLPDHDRTEVGEKGISLSGGQKARLQLARAVYARADVYLLDDILSAVDQHVGRHIIDNVVGPKGLLRGKTRILATNSIPVLKEAHQITMIKDGHITEQGSYLDAITRNGDIAALISTVKSSSSVPASPSSSKMASNPESDDEDIIDDLDEKMLLEKDRRASLSSLRRASTASFSAGRKGDEELALIPITRQTKETSEKGKVKWSVYGEYARACGINGVVLVLLSIAAAHSLQVGGNVWLKNWAEANEKNKGNPQVGKNIGVYFALGISSSTMLVIQTLILWVFCSIRASKTLHERMALAIFRSPMSFFETTPTGRILNRFSTDIFRVDEVISRSFNEFFGSTARALFTLIVITSSTPSFIVLIIPLGILYIYIQRYYLRSSRELKRLESTTKSPIYAHFGESLGGLSTIRAFKQQERWIWENSHRVDANLKAFFPMIFSNRWLGVRLEFIGAIVIFSSAALAIFSVVRGSNLTAGMVGLAMSYALQITQALNMIVRQSVDVEGNIVSVERVLEYSRLPSEAAEVVPGNRPPNTWPAKGAVNFHDYSMRYRKNLDLVLKNITLDIKPQEKIGVVGRTGAGKSSLTLSLFRVIEAASGGISIDDIDTSSIGLMDLRRKLAIIPQDAALFEGTIRDNLDPTHSKPDEELWEALQHARLKDHVGTMAGGLEAVVKEGGSNLSQGQKQLVSLARAILTRTNVLVLDEATAAVDVETDAMLQETLRGDLFKDRTIITIAHRINTIMDCDRIIVLDHGQVAEFDTPANLIKTGGFFYELAREAGLVENRSKSLIE